MAVDARHDARVPDGWSLVEFGSLGRTFGGLTGKSKKHFGSGDAKYVTFMNVVSNSVVDPFMHDNVVVQPGEAQNPVLAGDLLLNGSSETPEEVGLCSVVEEAPDPLFLNSFCFGFRPYPGASLHPRFMAYHLRGPVGREIMVGLAQGSTRYNLSKRALLAATLPLPSMAEQKAIAEALSDADALIESLEQLIAKKRLIKQGVMQELLTGKRRLPGFETKTGFKQTDAGLIPEDWTPGQLGDAIGVLKSGVSVNSVEDGSIGAGEARILKTSCIAGGQFIPHESKAIRPDEVGRAAMNPMAGSIIISRMNTPLLVGECGYVSRDYQTLFLPDRLWLASPASSATDFRWLTLMMSFGAVRRSIQAAATGTSGSMKNISKPGLRAVPIAFPGPDEQSAIADLMADLDAELTALEERLGKARQVKQGMMQQLLTGRIRLT